MSSVESPPAVMTVLVYSDDVTTRERVRLAVGAQPGRRPAQHRLRRVRHPQAVIKAVDAGGIDVLILDGEAVPSGGMGICRQLKDEIYECPPILVITGRREDAWLASWSRADAAVPHPIDGDRARACRRRVDAAAARHAPVR